MRDQVLQGESWDGPWDELGPCDFLDRSERIMNELKPMFPKIQSVEEAGGIGQELLLILD